MATPAVSALREAYPQARLTVLTRSPLLEFWAAFPGVNEALPLEGVGRKKGFSGYLSLVQELKKRKFDLAFLFPSSFSSAWLVFLAGIPTRVGFSGEGRDFLLTGAVPRSPQRNKHVVWEYLELLKNGLNLKTRKEKLQLLWPKAALKNRILGKIPGRNGFIALAPGATYGPAKRWPLPYWQELMEKILMERKETLLILGGPEEKEYLKGLWSPPFPKDSHERIHSLAGETSTLGLGSVLSQCRLLVTNDTGPMHAAAAVGTPTVALFGSTSPDWTRPFGAGHEVVYKHLECSPCFQKTCPIGYKCLHAISVDEVFGAVLKKLRRPSRVKPEKGFS
jgi:heptosyltransferase-2